MMNSIRSIVVCSLLVFAGAVDSVHAADIPVQQVTESEKVIRSEFARPDQGRHLYMKHHSNSISLEICGDICDFFTWKTSSGTTEVWDFVLLYEYQRGIGSQLEGIGETYKPKVEPLVLKLLAHYKKQCPAQTDRDKSLSCVLETLAERNHLRIGFTNYDEGGHCLAWGDVKDRTKISEYQCTEGGLRKGARKQ